MSLLSGPLPGTLTLLGAAGAAWLLIGPARWYFRYGLPIAAAVAALATGAGYWVVEKSWRPLPEPLDPALYLLAGATLLALLLVIPRIVVAPSAAVAVTSVVAASAVLVAAGARANVIYGSYPSLRAALGFTDVAHVDLDQVAPQPKTITGRPLQSAWRDPGGLPGGGRILTTAIDPLISGFTARPAQIYLPPAYFANPRPLLPVLILLAGAPGAPQDWIVSGRLVETMDEFAHAHEGLAPVVVVADGTGSPLGDPLCLDSKLGNAATYLSSDVPAWIRAHLQIDPYPAAWAIGGVSYGGTCALQLATNYPQMFPTFVDISGQDEPSLGDRQRTVNAAFGGDTDALLRVNPLDLLRTRSFPGSAGAFAVGADDAFHRPQVERVYHAAQQAGLDVRLALQPGAHSAAVAAAALHDELPWLATRLGLTTD
ncbi:alpha/beta hydrolase [Nocardia stercoris]|uniref:alpha/beta hydrolase n=1 Tax=Nocardia stercoris TaxID=2483361 RepID=UPI001F4064CE|nr:alpha/beta hydrolase-fold protein [Nocardia stercoris]